MSEAFASYGRYWLELFRLPLDVRDPASVQARFETEGFEHIDAGLAAGKGVVLALPHLGGFDFAAGWFVGRVGRPAAVVVEAVEPPELFDWFVRVRRECGHGGHRARARRGPGGRPDAARRTPSCA